MTFLAVILAASLTRSEMIERMRTPPVTRTQGLVQVYANCPGDMRDEFQGPVARFVSKICDDLYSATTNEPVRFASAGIAVIVGEGRTNDPSVVSRAYRRDDGSFYTRIYLPSPGSSDLAKFRSEVAKAFFLAVEKRVVDDKAINVIMRDMDPAKRIDHRYESIERWARGEKVEYSDDEMLRLLRSVIHPGVARTSDVLRFAARLYLYPLYFDCPFAGKYRAVTFRQAVDLMKVDPTVRFVAYGKAPHLVAYGGGRGKELADAATAYSNFLFELAKGKKDREELLDILDDADVKLNVALEEARKYEEGLKK